MRTFDELFDIAKTLERCRDMEKKEVFERLKMHLNEAFVPGLDAEHHLAELQYAQRYLYELLTRASDWVLQVQDLEKEEP
jgi:hypothetical protein